MAKVNKKAGAFRSLRVTLASDFYILVSVILLILGCLFLYFNFQAYNQALIGEHSLIAQGAANIVGGFLNDKLNELETAVRFGEPMSVSQEEQKIFLEKLLGTEPPFRQLSLLNAEKEELAKASRLSETSTSQLAERAEIDLFSQLAQGETYIGPIYIDETTGEPLLIMAVPIMSVFGNLRGALLAEINLKFMWDLVNQINIGKTGLVYVVNQQGDLIAFKDVNRILKRENLSYIEEVNEFIEGDPSAHENAVNISRGIERTYAVLNHAHLEETDWAVVTELPIKEAYSPLIRQVIISLLIILSLLISAIFAIMYISKKITEPIIDLRNAAVKISGGRLDTKIEVRTKDEIGELAQTFNQMTGMLKELYGGLEKKVQERTEELEEAKASLEIKVAARTRELKELNEQQEEIIEKRTGEIKKRMEELERFHRLVIGRELKMIELKKELKRLKNLLEKGSE